MPFSLRDRLTNLPFRTKLFAASVIYMFALFSVSEATGQDWIMSFWFATALPLCWIAALLAEWFLMRPRPTLGVAVGDLAGKARQHPFLAIFYGLAALVIEAFAVSSALGRPFILAG